MQYHNLKISFTFFQPQSTYLNENYYDLRGLPGLTESFLRFYALARLPRASDNGRTKNAVGSFSELSERNGKAGKAETITCSMRTADLPASQNLTSVQPPSTPPTFPSLDERRKRTEAEASPAYLTASSPRTLGRPSCDHHVATCRSWPGCDLP